TPAAYREFILRSRAEILCPKPVFRELHTGWFSDRSVCYLASGRPVLAEETGFSDRLPVGRGLVSFNTLAEAADGVAAIDSSYAAHSRAAREMAEAYFSHSRCLEAMLSASV
ncbi:MAG: glycosyltransferase family 1 protein, partial [Pseudomonadota bacterium]